MYSKIETSTIAIKRSVILLLIFEILDGVTTYIGLSLGATELNPLMTFPVLLIIVKTITTLFACYILQTKIKSNFQYILPGLVGTVVLWNILNILLV